MSVNESGQIESLRLSEDSITMHGVTAANLQTGTAGESSNDGMRNVGKISTTVPVAERSDLTKQLEQSKLSILALEQQLESARQAAKVAEKVSEQNIHALQLSLNQRFNEIAELTRLLEDGISRETIDMSSSQYAGKILELEGQLRQTQSQLAEEKSARLSLEHKLAYATAQIGGLFGKNQHNAVRRKYQWKRFFSSAKGLIQASSSDEKNEKEMLAVLRNSSLFDSDWYLEQYNDVKQSGMDAAEHYLRFGWKEMRDPSPDFSTAAYLSRYPDVALAGVVPLIHYITHGIKEGRYAQRV